MRKHQTVGNLTPRGTVSIGLLQLQQKIKELDKLFQGSLLPAEADVSVLTFADREIEYQAVSELKFTDGRYAYDIWYAPRGGELKPIRNNLDVDAAARFMIKAHAKGRAARLKNYLTSVASRRN